MKVKTIIKRYFLKIFFKNEFYSSYGSPNTFKVDGRIVGKYSYGFLPLLKSEVSFKSIGSFTSISRQVVITNLNHPTIYISTHPFFYNINHGNFQPKKVFYKVKKDLL